MTTEKTGNFSGELITRKKPYSLVLLFTGFVLCAALVPNQLLAQTEEQQLKEAFASFNIAFEKANVTVLSQLLTKNYSHTNQGNAPINASSWLNYIQSRRKQLDDGTLKITSYETKEVQFLIHGKSAIITGVVKASSLLNNKPKHTNIRFTQTWVLKDGKWMRAAFQDCKIK